MKKRRATLEEKRSSPRLAINRLLVYADLRFQVL